ncbi:MAG TPA: L,D-transpeptidase family protein [Gaiellaceae bacterium]|nr:L,D-transpeptidase family protein [Gaiellaceae bacterium]
MKRLCLLFVAGLLVASAPAAADDTPAPTTIPLGVTINGLDIGGMTADTASQAVLQAFQQPLRLQIGSTEVLVTPDVLGATPVVDRAIQRALVAQPNTAVPLGISIVSGTIADFVSQLAQRFDRAAADSQLSLRRLRPWLSPERRGRKLNQRFAVLDINLALASGKRDGIRLTLVTVRPKVTRRNFGPVIVIRRNANRLFLYDGMKYRRFFAVATGQRQYPTPLGRFKIVVKWKNPWWYPPNSPWAQGQQPIPPGPNNPLGTRWMGLSAPGVGIHGTPSDASIGYSVSHGCIRMHISQAEWLFNHVDVGTTVFIVAA